MTVSITIQADIKRMVRIQSGVINRISNSGRAMDRVATVMVGDILQHFPRQQGPRGLWKPLSPATVKGRRKGGRVGGTPKALLDTGRLRNSILPRSTRDSASVGTNVSYAAAHQEGTKNIPQRSFLWISKMATDKITKIIGNFIVKGT